MQKQRYKRRHKTCVWHDNPWTEGCEPGDLMVDDWGNLYSLKYTCSHDGHLLTAKVKPPWKDAKAVIRENGTKQAINHWPGMNEKRAKARMELHNREVWWVDKAAFEKERSCQVQ